MTKLTINGYKLEINAVSPLAPKAIEIQHKKKFPEPEKPSYVVPGVGGVEEVFDHTPETLDTDEEKLAWKKWQEDHEQWSSGFTYKLLRLFLVQGVTLKATAKQLKDLESNLEVLEIDVPESETERNLFYLETFILTSETDMQQVIEAVLAKTGIKEDALDAANALFPDTVE